MSGIFVCVERKAKFPLIPLETFKSSSNVAALAIGFFHDFVGLLPSSLALRDSNSCSNFCG